MARLQRLKSKAITSFNNENAAGGVFTALDRTMSGLEMQTRVTHANTWGNTAQDVTSVDPATFDPSKMVLRLSTSEAGITTDEGLIRVTGYNYHELSHLIYGPPASVTENFINSVATDIRDKLRSEGEVYMDEHIKGFVQLILCMHSEHKMLRQYLGIAPYFIEVLVDRVHSILNYVDKVNRSPERAREAFTAATYVLFTGRVYFPKSFREHMRKVFVEKRTALVTDSKLDSNSAWAQTSVITDELDAGLRKFLTLDFYGATQGEIRQHIIETVTTLGKALSPFRTFDVTEFLNVFHLANQTSQAQTPSSHMMPTPDLNKIMSALDAERKKNNSDANNSPEVPENEDQFEGEGGDSTESDSGDGDGENQEDGSGDDSDQDQDSDQDGQEDGQDGGSDSDADDDTEDEEEGADGDSEGDEDEGEAKPQQVNGGTQAGSETAEHSKPKSLTDQMKEKLDNLTDYVKGNSQIQNEIRERRRAVTNPSGKQLLNFADRAQTTEEKVTPEMTLLSKRVSSEFSKLTEDADPGFVRHQSSGRLNVQRAMTGDVELDQLFDRWDEGQMDATEVESVYLIDVSGSMNQHLNKVTRALWILKRGIEASSNNSGVTVLAYDTQFEIMSGSDEKEKLNVYRNLSTGGGTNPYNALQAAQSVLSTSRRSNKLMTILTDGQWQDAVGAHRIIDEMNASGVHTGLMFYSDRSYGFGGGGSTGIDSHHCQVSDRVNSLSDVLAFTRNMIRSSMRV